MNPQLSHRRTIHEMAAQGELYDFDKHLVDSVDMNGLTPLHWAAGYGQNPTVEILLSSGADPNVRTKDGKTALMFASSKGFFHVVKTLIRGGARLNHTDDLGNTALMYAAHQNQALVIQELLRNGVDMGVQNRLHQTAYGLALLKQNKSARASIEAYLLSLVKRNGSGYLK